MFDEKRYKETFDDSHAPESVITEVLSMTVNRQTETVPHKSHRRVLVIAAAAVLLLMLTVTAYAVGGAYYGWNNSFTVWETETANGVHLRVSQTDNNIPNEPVALEDGRLYLTINDQHLDISDQVSRTKAYVYQFSEVQNGEKIIHNVIVGLNGPELADYAYAIYMGKEGGDWMVSVSGPENSSPKPTPVTGPGAQDWLGDGLNQIDFPIGQPAANGPAASVEGEALTTADSMP